MLNITLSTDWSKIKDQLTSVRAGPPPYAIISKCHMIDMLITELSKEEVECRRRKRQTRRHKEILDRINLEIHAAERDLLMYTLMQKG